MERFGRFELVRHLATGGMADVFLARVAEPPAAGKILVVKRILPALAKRSDYVQMFLDEAKIGATLQHANIVEIYDIGVASGLHFLAMEYLHGKDLSQILRLQAGRSTRRALPLDCALRIVTSVADGLHYAHEQCDEKGRPLGIVHRDISPQNVFVTFDGAIKIVDFGIAKAEGRATHTRTGMVKGKLGYMAPEQCRSLPVDRRTDVFAVTVLLWESTVGRRLYLDTDEYAVLRRIVEEDAPSPSRYVDGYPPELERIVMRGLARDAEKRQPTAEVLRQEIEEFARKDGVVLSAASLAAHMRELFPEAAASAEAFEEATETVVVSPIGGDTNKFSGVDTQPVDGSTVSRPSGMRNRGPNTLQKRTPKRRSNVAPVEPKLRPPPRMVAKPFKLPFRTRHPELFWGILLAVITAVGLALALGGESEKQKERQQEFPVDTDDRSTRARRDAADPLRSGREAVKKNGKPETMSEKVDKAPKRRTSKPTGSRKPRGSPPRRPTRRTKKPTKPTEDEGAVPKTWDPDSPLPP